MNKLFLAMVATLIMFSFGTANASNWYMTGNYNYTTWDNHNNFTPLSVDNTNGAGLGVGYDISPWFAVELTADYLGKDDLLFLGFDTGIDAKARSFGVWAVADPTVTTIAGMPLRVIARLGLTNTRAELTAGGFSVAETDTKVAYGGGLALGVTDHLDLTAQYTHRRMDIAAFGGLNLDFNTVSAGVRYHF